MLASGCASRLQWLAYGENMQKKHFVKIQFGVKHDNAPEIYDFLWLYLPRILHSMKFENVKLTIERLEPLDQRYTNLEMPEAKIKKIFDDFAGSHHLHEVADAALHREKATLTAKLPVKNLAQALKDYNVLFDIFFADVVINADGKLTIDMMNGFENSALAIGDKKILDKFSAELQKHTKTRLDFFSADHKNVKKRN